MRGRGGNVDLQNKHETRQSLSISFFKWLYYKAYICTLKLERLHPIMLTNVDIKCIDSLYKIYWGRCLKWLEIHIFRWLLKSKYCWNVAPLFIKMLQV